jgi:hypothetical protein
VLTDWLNLSPEMLLKISTAFIRPGVSDNAERQWLCADLCPGDRTNRDREGTGEQSGCGQAGVQRPASTILSQRRKIGRVQITLEPELREHVPS